MPQVWRWVGPVCVLLLAAAALRVPLLDRRPMHADEAILADKFGALLATGAYPYDPREYHGPVLAYLAWITAHLAGRTTYAALTETTLRIVPAIAGILVALSPLVLAPEIGATAALAAAALLAVSPVMVYYSRDFIPEMPLALWTALLLAALMRRSARSWALAGAAAALMCATKETAVLALGSAGIAYAAAFRPRRLNDRAAAIFCAALVTGISALVLPPWKWGILPEALRAYLGRGLSGGLHAHPWYSYFEWLLGWRYSFSEAPVLLLAAAGLVAARRNKQPAIRFLSFYAVLLFVFYSAIPYKTPWCAVSLLYALALLAGVAVAALDCRWRAATRIALGVVIFGLGAGAWVASVPYATDPRNPWVYAQTGLGVFTIRDQVEAYARAASERQNVAIDVYTRDNLWPLPWYLRRFPNVRWWRQVVIAGPAAPIVLVSPALEPDLVRKVYEGPPPGERELYMNLFPTYVELRPQVEIRGYVAKSLWDRQQRDR
jgi:predicted membrane-bound mannosyltransferase